MYRKKTGLLILAILMMASVTATLHAATDKTPDAETILEKYIEVIGGRDALKKINTKVTEVAMVQTGKSNEIKTTTYMVRPDKVYSISEFKALGMNVKSESGTNGKVVWEMIPMKKRVLSGLEKERRLMDYAFDGAIVDWKKYYKKMTLIGEETVNGKACYKVAFTPMDQQGDDMVYYFDKDKYLIEKVTREVIVSGDTKKVELFFSDYTKADNLLIPYTVKRVGEDGKEFVITIKSLKTNVDIPPSKFELPEKIEKIAKG